MLMTNHSKTYLPDDSGVVIFNMRNQQYYSLDGLAALVWTLMQQPRTFGELYNAVMEHFDVDAEECERDLLSLLEQMEHADLIQAERSA